MSLIWLAILLFKICWVYLSEINKTISEAENSITPESAVLHNQRKTNELTLLHKPDEVGCPAVESNELKAIVSVQEENAFDSGPEECAVDREDKSNTPMLISESGSHSKLNENDIKENKNQESDKAVQQRPKVPFRQPLMQRHQLSLLEKVSLKNVCAQKVVTYFFTSSCTIIVKVGIVKEDTIGWVEENLFLF